MSQNLIFKFKKENIVFYAQYLCTTPARILADSDIFLYAPVEVQLDESDLTKCCTRVQEKIKFYKDCLQEYRQKLNNYMNLLVGCQSEVAYKNLKCDIHEIQTSIDDFKEYIEEWEEYKQVCENLLNLLLVNEDWILVYTNC